ncbi:MAG: hypothetical protein WCF64_10820 [Methylocella sp.]
MGRGTRRRAEERPRVLAGDIRARLLAKIAAKPEATLRGRWRAKPQVGVSGILCKQPLWSLVVVLRGQRAGAGKRPPDWTVNCPPLLGRPIAPAGTIAKELGVTPRAAHAMAA